MSRLACALVAGAVLLGLVVAPAPAADLDATLARGVAAYQRGQELTDRNERLAAFEEARRAFEHAAGEGAANGEVWFNAGTAALQGEDLGRAVLDFRRALVEDPQHTRAQRNLVHARGLLPAWLPKPTAGGALESFFFWHRMVAYDVRRGLAAVAFLAGCLFAGGWILRPSSWLRSGFIAAAIVWALITGSTYADRRSGLAEEAVLVAPETVARAADSTNAPARFAEALPAGAEVRVTEARPDWLRVQLADGSEAWIPASAAEMVRPAG
jgi:tetratricopeptide (TPR) repeat protein